MLVRAVVRDERNLLGPPLCFQQADDFSEQSSWYTLELCKAEIYPCENHHAPYFLDYKMIQLEVVQRCQPLRSACPPKSDFRTQHST